MDTLRHTAPRGSDLEPLRAALIVLAAEDSLVPAVRGFTAAAFAQWRLLAGDAALVVTELTSNAARAARAAGRPVILVRITPGQARVVIEVGDPSSLLPSITPQQPGQEPEHGRGLRLVIALASQAGWYTAGRWKIVWAVLPARAAPPEMRAPACHEQGRAA